MEEGNPAEPELTELVYPYAKTAMYIYFVGRVILMLISLKRLSVCRYYLYYEFLFAIIVLFLPQDLTLIAAN